MARTFGTPQGHFLSLPQPLSKAHVLNMWLLVKAYEFPNDVVCNEMSAPCGLARQQVRSKAEFAHPCVESFVPSRKQDVCKCLAHVVCWPLWYDMLWPWLQPSGTKWNRIRNRATLLGFLRRHFFTTKWNRVEPSQEPSYLLGFLAKTISAPSLIIILIKSRDSRNRGPQNEINCRTLPREPQGDF